MRTELDDRRPSRLSILFAAAIATLFVLGATSAAAQTQQPGTKIVIISDDISKAGGETPPSGGESTGGEGEGEEQ